ncbi:hypothetical protein ACFSHT_22150 [Paraburkholderia silviterrae]|uniref:Uncharacterized protein n=1 Tax=Paraburkholderia silviterrae TaxID=2528715 RepID=A0A4R5MF73_9BURK|nr:hypothetical protein [Paraburkholderia silviterrae]TDG25909.1 hypothetical protein EYW47_00630 [Paraburkholderia silviterrae]
MDAKELKLVPIEPDDEMQTAGALAVRMDATAINRIWTANAVFRAMVAAAPAALPSDAAQAPIYQAKDRDAAKWLDCSEYAHAQMSKQPESFDTRIIYAAPVAPAAPAPTHLADGTVIDKSVVKRLAVQFGLLPDEADHSDEPRLDKRAKVGNTRFGVGVKWSTVIGAAIRQYEYDVTPEKEAQRIADGKAFWTDIVRASAVPQAGLTDEQMEALSDFIFRDMGSPSDWTGFDLDGARRALLAAHVTDQRVSEDAALDLLPITAKECEAAPQSGATLRNEDTTKGSISIPSVQLHGETGVLITAVWWDKEKPWFLNVQLCNP